MREKIQNSLVFEVYGADMTTATDIEIHISQEESGFSKTYTPTVVDAKTLTVTIPYADAMQLHRGCCLLQLYFTDEDGVPVASDSENREIKDLIKPTGYNP